MHSTPVDSADWVQYGVLVTLIIGLVPLVVALYNDRKERHRDQIEDTKWRTRIECRVERLEEDDG